MSKILKISSAECDYIKSFYNLEEERSSDSPGHVMGKDGKLLEIRYGERNKSFYCTITDKLLLNFLVQKLESYNIVNITSVRIMKYLEGCVLAPHVDAGSHNRYGKTTKENFMSISIQLSDPTVYTGGVLIVEGKPQSKELGAVASFKSNQEHEVTLITSGIRYSLILYLTEDQLNLKKTLF